MAHSGFCSNEQILMTALQKYQSHPHHKFTALMMFLEEFKLFLAENAAAVPSALAAELGKDRFKLLKPSEKERYEELADFCNGIVFQ